MSCIPPGRGPSVSGCVPVRHGSRLRARGSHRCLTQPEGVATFAGKDVSGGKTGRLLVTLGRSPEAAGRPSRLPPVAGRGGVLRETGTGAGWSGARGAERRSPSTSPGRGRSPRAVGLGLSLALRVPGWGRWASPGPSGPARAYPPSLSPGHSGTLARRAMRQHNPAPSHSWRIRPITYEPVRKGTTNEEIGYRGSRRGAGLAV